MASHLFSLSHLSLRAHFHQKRDVLVRGRATPMEAMCLSNDPGEVDSSFFCYVATVLSPQRNVLIFTRRMHKPT